MLGKIHKAILKKRILNLHETMNILDLSKKPFDYILYEKSGMTKLCSKLLPKLAVEQNMNVLIIQNSDQLLAQ